MNDKMCTLYIDLKWHQEEQDLINTSSYWVYLVGKVSKRQLSTIDLKSVFFLLSTWTWFSEQGRVKLVRCWAEFWPNSFSFALFIDFLYGFCTVKTNLSLWEVLEALDLESEGWRHWRGTCLSVTWPETLQLLISHVKAWTRNICLI